VEGARRQAHAWGATALYALLAVILTWPVAKGLTRDVPADLIDPLLNCWIIAWGADHVVRFLSGEWGAFSGFWNANIFHPHPLTLAYSEHLFAQSVFVAPIYALTRNVILCYNVLFLSTFVLSGLGAYLLLRDLTADTRAALVGGLLFAFIPYRFEQMPHLQAMSTQWMPFALLGLRRYIATGRPKPLIWGAVALVAHNLSCGYYLLYFAPVVAAFVLHQMAAGRHLFDWRRWLGLTLTAGLVIAVALPFLLPYKELRHREATERSLLTVEQYSADLAAYVTATPRTHVWGSILTGFERPEGHLFPGAVPLALAAAAIGFGVRRRWRQAPTSRGFGLRAVFALPVAAVVGWWLADAVPLAPRDGYRIVVVLPGVRALVTTFTQLSCWAIATVLLFVVLSARARAVARAALPTFTAFCAAALIACVWLSLGVTPRLLGERLGIASPYGVLFATVPGFDGLRAPTRYAAIGVLFLALLGGLGAAALHQRLRRGHVVVAAASALFVVEVLCIPVTVNKRWKADGVHAPAAPGREARPPVYDAVRQLPESAVLAELPFGITAYEVRAMYYSTFHWKRIMNGYSGHFPRGYLLDRFALRRILRDPDRAVMALHASGVTHVVVHEWATTRRQGVRMTAILANRGARLLARMGGDVLLEMPPAPTPP
jgi:hypothetical protein